MIAKFLVNLLKPDASPELRANELEVWKRNRHFIWIFAVVSSLFTYLSISSYYNVKIKGLEQELAQAKGVIYANESASNLQSVVQPSIKGVSSK